MNIERLIEKVLVVSTAHLLNEREIENCGRIFYAMEEYGWMVFCGAYCGVPPEGVLLNPGAEKILEAARKHGCEWVRFDRDGDVIDGINTYDW